MMFNSIKPVRKLYQYFHSRTDIVLRSVLKNSGWAATGQAVNSFVLLVETLLLARFLSIEIFGVLIVLVSTTELIFGLLDFRTGEAVIKFLPELKQNRGKRAVSSFLHLVILIDGAVSAIGLFIIIALSFFFVELIGLPPQYASLLIILGIGKALETMVRSVGSYLRVTGLFPLSIKLGIVSMLSRLVIVFIVLMIAPHISVISWAIVLSNSMFFILMLSAAIISFHSLNLHPLTEPIMFNTAERKSITTFLLSINFAGTLRALSKKLDVIIIAVLSSTGVVALYKVAARIACTLLLFSDPLLIAVFPEMSKLHSRNASSQLRKILITLTKSLTLLAAFLVFILVFFGEEILRMLAGAKYAEAHLISVIMIIGTSFTMIFFWARPLLLVYGKASKLVLIAIVGVIIQFGCLYMLVPKWGAQGAGLAFALYYFTITSLFLYLLFKSGDIPVLKRQTEYV